VERDMGLSIKATGTTFSGLGRGNGLF
jgi:hypothetical protein